MRKWLGLLIVVIAAAWWLTGTEAGGGDLRSSIRTRSPLPKPPCGNRTIRNNDCGSLRNWFNSILPHRSERTEPVEKWVAVGTVLTNRPPHRSVRAQLTHTAPTLDVGVKSHLTHTDHPRGHAYPPLSEDRVKRADVLLGWRLSLSPNVRHESRYS